MSSRIIAAVSKEETEIVKRAAIDPKFRQLALNDAKATFDAVGGGLGNWNQKFVEPNAIDLARDLDAGGWLGSASAVESPDSPDVVDATDEGTRKLLRRFVSPVVVVTVDGEKGARGATIGSFASVSLNPPKMCFSVMHGTRFHNVLADDARVAIHLLAEDQADLAEWFAVPGLEAETQASPFRHHIRPSPPLLLSDTLGILLGHIVRRVGVDDHTLVITRIERLLTGRDGVKPLVYLEQSYRGIGKVVQ